MKDFTDDLKPAEPSGPSILEYERIQSNISTKQLAHHLLHRDNFLPRQEKILQILHSHAIFNKRNQLNLSRPDRFHLALARAKKLRRLSLEHKWDMSDYRMADYLVDEMSPYFLQSSMFATSVREQGNESQRAYWVPKIENWDIIGCYGQTELGHGSNVRGIETLAIWDPNTKEFIMHSPTLTASKWWNGSLGRTANHAIVVAQLMLPEAKTGELKSHGPHQFIMQIRDMKTHKSLPGIVIGDIGPKYGYQSMDNGYMLFNKHRIPYEALLSRYSGVDSETGTYAKPDNPATMYGTLTYVRANYVERARLALARAVTIAIRYTAIRRQFADRDVSPTSPSLNGRAPAEEAVLNYPTVQIRLLPLLATTFALHYTGEAMLKLYWSTRSAIEKSGDFSRLAEMHAQSSGLKSLCTMLAADGIETCRRSMGGHGFGGGSGIIPLNGDYLSKVTVEGDNWMITQQTASYLIKRMAETVKKPTLQPRDQVDVMYWHYMRNRKSRDNSTADIFGDLSSSSRLSSSSANTSESTSTDAEKQSSAYVDREILRAFQRRASHLAYEAYMSRMVHKKSWTEMMIQLHRLAQAHSEMLLVMNFHDALFSLSSASSSSSSFSSTTTDSENPAKPKTSPHPPLDTTTIQVLHHLYRLFAYSLISSNIPTSPTATTEFLLSHTLTTAQISQLPTYIHDLMFHEIRPHAVRLVDSWSIPDYLLQSALGRQDGDVYGTLFRMAHKENEVLNGVVFNPDWKSEEVIMGEGEEEGKKRVERLAVGGLVVGEMGESSRGLKAKL